jgi:hypothetical protein
MTTTINASTTAGLVQTADTSGVLALQTANTTALTINSSQVVNFANAPTVAGSAFTASQWTTTGSNIYYNTGNVGVGTTSPASPLQINTAGVNTTVQINSTDASGGYGAVLSLNNTGTGGREYWIGSTSNSDGSVGGGKFKFYDATAGATRMLINSSGVVMFSTTSTIPASASDSKGISLYTDGTTSQIFATGNNDTALCVNRYGSDGALIRTRRGGSDVGSISVTASATAYNTSSDYRLKENIASMTGALAKVALLKPVTYKWKVDGSDGEGFIAHELAEVKPDCVSGDKDAVDKDGKPVYQGIDTSFLVATLTAAIQELKAINDTQAELISGQAATINALVTRIEALENRA